MKLINLLFPIKTVLFQFLLAFLSTIPVLELSAATCDDIFDTSLQAVPTRQRIGLGLDNMPIRNMLIQYNFSDPFAGVRRYTAQEVDEQEAFISSDGLLVRQNGQLIDTVRSSSGELISEEAYLILTIDGRLIIHNPNTYITQTRHSSWGSRNRFAGEIVVHNGVVVLINNGSGHFRYTPAALYQFVELLRLNGVNLSRARIVEDEHSIRVNGQ